MTKKEALELCVKLWTDISESDCDVDINDWDDLHDYKHGFVRKYGEFEGDCPCCEYTKTECDNCPITKWSHEYTGCCHAEYGKWVRAVYDGDHKKARKYALKIVKLAQKELEVL